MVGIAVPIVFFVKSDRNLPAFQNFLLLPHKIDDVLLSICAEDRFWNTSSWIADFPNFCLDVSLKSSPPHTPLKTACISI